MEQFKLYLNEEAVDVKLKEIITAKIRGEGIDILSEMEQLDPALKLRRKMLEIALDARDKLPNADNKTDEELYKEAVTTGLIPKDTVKELANYSMELNTIKPEVEKQLDRMKIDLFKILVDMKSVPSNIKELWNDNNFWSEQDLGGMLEAINSFLDKAKLNASRNIKI